MGFFEALVTDAVFTHKLKIECAFHKLHCVLILYS